MSLRRKYPNNKAGRKQRRIAEEKAEIEKRKEADADAGPVAAESKVTKVVARFAVVPYINTGEHALALYDTAEARLKSNMKFMSDAELKECTDKFIFMLEHLRTVRSCRDFKRKWEEDSRAYAEPATYTE